MVVALKVWGLERKNVHLEITEIYAFQWDLGFKI